MELSETPDYAAFRDGDFLRIKMIVHFGQHTELIGLRIRRTRKSGGLLGWKTNECYMIAVDDDLDKSLERVPLAHAFQKRDMKITNALPPYWSFREHTQLSGQGSNHVPRSWRVQCDAALVCRYIHSPLETSTHRPPQAVLRRVSEAEADPQWRAQDSKLKADWRGQQLLRPQHTYTYGDCFSGAGGAAMGAYQADLDIAWAVDCDHNAAATFRGMFPLARFEERDVTDFLRNESTFKCDIMHLSPPCQAFSPANRTVRTANPHSATGRSNEANQAIMTAVGDLVKKGRSRVVTVEQTSGLLTHYPGES